MVQAICRVVVGKEQVAPKPPAQDPPKKKRRAIPEGLTPAVWQLKILFRWQKPAFQKLTVAKPGVWLL
jgi:hypothetical protein